MKKRFEIATVIVAIMVLSVLMVPIVMSGLGDENTTDVSIAENLFEITKGDLISSAFIANQTNVSESDRMPLSVVTNVYNETYKENVVVNKSSTEQNQTISTSSVTILDHTMCKAIDADNYPIDRTTQFYTTDESAIFWYKATDLHVGDNFTKKWYDPSGNLYKEGSSEVTGPPPPSEMRQASFLYISGTPAANKPGNWHVSLYCNGVWAFTEYFTISDSTPTPEVTGKIAFVSDRDGDFEIYVMDADGTNVTKLTSNTATDWEPEWSPACKKIAFSSDRGGDFEIYVMDADGTNVTKLTSNTASDDYPSWSPDGSKIAFHSDRDGDGEIYVMDADGTNVVKLTSNTAIDWCSPSVWSPDGSKLAFESDRDGDFEIYIMDADGTNVTKLTSNTACDWCPAWSPDGSKLAFESDRDGDFEIYIMDANGTNVTKLTSNTAVDSSPAWSPDGSKLAFESNRDGDGEIYVMNADGTNVVKLTSNTAIDFMSNWCSPRVSDYDINGNGIIEKNEAGNAAKDYFDGKITMEQALEVLLLHFATQP